MASYQDLFGLPDHIVGEIIHGQFVTHPRPAPRHAWASSNLGGELVIPFQNGRGGPGGWVILDEPELHVNGQILVPDLAGWRRERLPQLPETPYFEIPPDWVCEVLAPSTAQVDRADKMPLYAEMDVGFAWLVDPDAQTLEVLVRREDGHWLLEQTRKADDQVTAPPFEAITFNLSVLWP